MRSALLLSLAILLSFAASLTAKAWLTVEDDPAPAEPATAQRILSLAPSITETLYALGCGDRVVGVTNYCDYPPEVKQKTRVGGYHDPSLERMVGLRADLVAMLDGSTGLYAACRKLGMRPLVVSHKSIDGILDSLTRLGEACDARQRASAILAELDRRMDRVRRKTEGLQRPVVLVVVDRLHGLGRLQDLTIAGCDGHLDAMIRMAGGENGYRHGRTRFPVVSAEGLLSMDPDVIVDLVPPHLQQNPGWSEAQERADWAALADLRAVRADRIHIVTEEYAMRPSPRFILMVERLARLIHPEVDWGS